MPRLTALTDQGVDRFIQRLQDPPGPVQRPWPHLGLQGGLGCGQRHQGTGMGGAGFDALDGGRRRLLDQLSAGCIYFSCEGFLGRTQVQAVGRQQTRLTRLSAQGLSKAPAGVGRSLPELFGGPGLTFAEQRFLGLGPAPGAVRE